jgi:hypothetical protein
MWNPEDYAQHSDAQLKWARELRSRLNLRGDESLLDVGCGDGKITADFAKTIANGRVIGVDSSPEMVNYASQTYPTSQYPNLQFLCMDARSLVLAETFDVVFSNATLHWVPVTLAQEVSVSAPVEDFSTLNLQFSAPVDWLALACGFKRVCAEIQGSVVGIFKVQILPTDEILMQIKVNPEIDPTFLQNQIQASYENARMVLNTVRNTSTLGNGHHRQESAVTIAEHSLLDLFQELAIKL